MNEGGRVEPSAVLSAVVLVGFAAVAATPRAARADAAVAADLATLAGRTVLFGHQSVGRDLVDGVRDLVAEERAPLRIAEVHGAAALSPGTFAHAYVAENGDPLRKLQSFERLLAPAPAPVDVALVKFCFVDVFAETDVKALFARYDAAFRALRAAHPRTTFVHVTIPLTTVPTGPKAWVKRLLGRERSEAHNARRDEYNALLRTAYAGREPVFDLARLEATAPDGRAETYDWNGRSVPALVPAYTADGGHLNAAGRRRAARELVHLLAALPPAGGGVAAGSR